MPRFHAAALALLIATLALVSQGCASYAVRSQAADMTLFADDEAARLMADRESQTQFDIEQALRKKPLAAFPTGIAVAQVEGIDVSRYSRNATRARYALVGTRQHATEDQLAKIQALSMVVGVAPINRMLLVSELEDDAALREAAARLHADLLLVYTFDTEVYLGDTDSPVDVVTLGFIPSRTARVASTASSLLLDTRNGYLYAVAEGSSEHTQPANLWTTRSAVDDARRRAERDALADMVDSFADAWPTVIEQHAPAAAHATP
ncbi:MAG: hypothetical protein AAF823_16335 [Planctomycetota bacterium]